MAEYNPLSPLDRFCSAAPSVLRSTHRGSKKHLDTEIMIKNVFALYTKNIKGYLFK